MLTIKTTGARTEFEPGELIEVEASWDLDFDPDSIEIRLSWSTRGKGDQDSEVSQTMPVDNPGPSGSHRFPWSLPASPYSFSGRLVSLVWSMELIVEPGGTTCSSEIVIAPGGREVVLHRSDADHESA